jgi:hypothetical protein
MPPRSPRTFYFEGRFVSSNIENLAAPVGVLLLASAGAVVLWRNQPD